MLTKLRKTARGRHLITSVLIILSSLVQTYELQAFAHPAGILPAGFTGLSVLINKISLTVGLDIKVSLLIVLLNIPVALLCIKHISLRFTIYSLVQVFLTSFFLNIFNFKPIFDDNILMIIFGGFLGGFQATLALQGDASTGGTDFIALYVSNLKGKSIWNQVFIGNAIMLTIYGMLFGFEYAGRSILFQFISTKTISTFHHRYDRVTMLITTTKPDEVIKEYTKNFRHGISKIEAVGGYSGKKMYILHTVISSYEQRSVAQLMKKQDPNIIINIFKTTDFVGGFHNIPIE